MGNDETAVTMLGTLRPWKGITAYCEPLFEGLRDAGLDTEFINWKSIYPSMLYPGGSPKKTEEFYEGSNVRTLLQWWNPLSWLYAGATFKGDILNVHWWSHYLAPVYWTLMILSKLRGKTNIVSVHHVLPHERSLVNDLLNLSVFHLGDKYTFHSEKNRGDFLDKYGFNKEDTVVVPHPPMNVPKTGMTQGKARELLEIPEDKNVLLFFGNIRPYKGLDILIENLPAVRDNVEDLHVLIVGNPWDDGEEFREQIRENSLEDITDVYFEYVPDNDIEQYFTAADFVVLPYRKFDAFSSIPVIAKEFNTPSIGTEKGSLGEQVDYMTTLGTLGEDIIELMHKEKLLVDGAADEGITQLKTFFEQL